MVSVPVQCPHCVSGQRRALLTEAIEVRTEGILSEVLFPQAGREEMDVEGGMGIDPLEHIDEVDVRLHTL